MRTFSLANVIGHALLNGLIVSFGIAFLFFYADTIQHQTDAAFGMIAAPAAGLIAFIVSFITGLILKVGAMDLASKSKVMSPRMILLVYIPSLFMGLIVLFGIM